MHAVASRFDFLSLVAIALAARARAQVHFNYTPDGETEPTHQYIVSGNPATDSGGVVVERDSNSNEIGYLWHKEGNDIVVTDISETIVIVRIGGGAIQEEGPAARFDGDGKWINIDYS